MILIDPKFRYEVTEPNQDLNYNIKWMLMPDGRDNIQPAIISGLQPNDEHISDVNGVKFYLYTR